MNLRLDFPADFLQAQNLPFQVKNPRRLAVNWVVFCVLGFGAPLAVIKFQRWKQS